METILSENILVFQTRTSEGDLEVIGIEASLSTLVLVAVGGQEPLAAHLGVGASCPMKEGPVLKKSRQNHNRPPPYE